MKFRRTEGNLPGSSILRNGESWRQHRVSCKDGREEKDLVL